MRFPLLPRAPAGLAGLLLTAWLPALSALETAPSPLLPPSFAPPQCLALGDLNQDGAPDLVVLSRRGIHSLSVLLGQDGRLRRSTGALCPAFPFYAPATVRAVLRDVNRDGWPDLILLGPAWERIALFLNQGQLHGEWQGLAETPPGR